MKKLLQKYIDENSLFKQSDKILLAISGGLDSLCLAHLLMMNDYQFGLAHVNFQLRGEASDGDAAFVEAFAKAHRIPFYTIAFDTNAICIERKQCVQNVARDLRYNWLENIRQSNGYQYIATAHHMGDNAETVLYNITKGTGMRGLHGILPKQGKIIRPLLFASRKHINAYAQEHELAWREDISNADTKYTRNKIRHQIVPLLQGINPRFEETMDANIKRWRDLETLANYAIEQAKKAVFSKKEGIVHINIAELQSCPAPPTILYEIIKDYGFNSAQVGQILKSLDKVGNHFMSPSHELTIDRICILISQKEDIEGVTYAITLDDVKSGEFEEMLSFEVLSSLPNPFPRDKALAFVDMAALSFPLTLRHWQEGDKFKPFGMKGKSKKLQDFYSDEKVPRFKKDKIWLLVNADKEIIWVCGMRASESFKVTSTTQKVLQLTLQNP